MARCEQHQSIIQESLAALRKEKARTAIFSLSALCFLGSVVGAARTDAELMHYAEYRYVRSIDTLERGEFEDLLGHLIYSPSTSYGKGGSPAHFVSPTLARISIENILKGLGYIDPMGVDTIGPKLREISASLPEECPEQTMNKPDPNCDFTVQRTKLMSVEKALEQDRSTYLGRLPSDLVNRNRIFGYAAIAAALLCEATAFSLTKRSR